MRAFIVISNDPTNISQLTAELVLPEGVTDADMRSNAALGFAALGMRYAKQLLAECEHNGLIEELPSVDVTLAFSNDPFVSDDFDDEGDDGFEEFDRSVTLRSSTENPMQVAMRLSVPMAMYDRIGGLTDGRAQLGMRLYDLLQEQIWRVRIPEAR